MTGTMTDTEALTIGKALKLLEPFRGLRGEYRKALGDLGDRALHVVANGSPMQAVEFLGYARTSRSFIGERWRKLGLATHKRDWTDPEQGWQGVAGDAGDAGAEAARNIADLRADYRRQTSIVERAHEVTWTVPSGTEFVRLICVSDLHYGARAMDYPRWLDMRDWIAGNPDVRWLFHGDLLDLATTQAPGRAMLEQALSFDNARDLAEDDLRPIAAQCMGMLTGNHDLRVARALQVDFDPVRDLCKRLHIPYLGYENWVRWHITSGAHKRRYDTYHHHGWGGGRTAGSKANKVVAMARCNHADAVVMGHTHDLFTVSVNSTVLDEEGAKRVVEVPAVNAGSYFKHAGYPREQGYAPSSLGAATLHFYLDRHSVHART